MGQKGSPITNWRTKVTSAVEFNYDGSLVTDVTAMWGTREAQFVYSISYQSQSGAPQPYQVPWYGYNQSQTNSSNIAEFNDFWGYHHRQTTTANGFGNGNCTGNFSYTGLLGYDEEYVMQVSTN
jgi:hypothetical protein